MANEPTPKDHAVKQYWNPYVAGVALGTVLFLAFLLTGSGLGASGGIARVVVQVLKVVAPSVVDRNPYFAPMGGGFANPLNNHIVWMVLGVLLGGFISGLISGRTRLEIYHGPRVRPAQRLVLAFIGGAFMGWGAAMARGCTSGQALSGGAVLSLGSWVFMMMIFAAGYALAYPFRRFWL
ncbi:MAG: YeeE/YedE family protein [Thermogutta sp.]|uniref:YeeE/YedE thiosulfate transporter family protein n=1 Tax=Thermogutta sp. TaxID=1962930 RepID=UPI00198B1D70|nr:YeeE/YedE thiosulfate transporter family protein [Thermogutta sp.]MBC7353845.1 YeeE/YedE family protein [Thermogutta sp.]